jgi:hypothetical protein
VIPFVSEDATHGLVDGLRHGLADDLSQRLAQPLDQRVALLAQPVQVPGHETTDRGEPEGEVAHGRLLSFQGM